MKINPIICAIDTTSVEGAKTLAEQIRGHVGALKLGLEFFTANGAAGVREVSQSGLPIFLDLKFHDIPNTVAGAIKALGDLNIFMITVHTSGGLAMLKAAKEAAMSIPSKPKVVGVTVLTSLDTQDMNQIGYRHDTGSQAQHLANLAQSAGIDGVVCSAFEAASIRSSWQAATFVGPGIRPAGSDVGDQKRVMTPKEALEAGADYLVIGRPITGAADPKAAAAAILNHFAH